MPGLPPLPPPPPDDLTAAVERAAKHLAELAGCVAAAAPRTSVLDRVAALTALNRAAGILSAKGIRRTAYPPVDRTPPKRHRPGRTNATPKPTTDSTTTEEQT